MGRRTAAASASPSTGCSLLWWVEFWSNGRLANRLCVCPLFNRFHHFQAGLGICSSVFWANHSFFVSEKRFTCEKEWNAPVALLSSATWANRLLSLFFKEQRERIAHGCSFVPERHEHLAHGRPLKKCDWAKSNGSKELFGKKRGENYKNIWKIRLFQIFPSELLIFKRFAQVALSMSNLSKLLMHCDKSLDDFRAIAQSAAGIKWYITEVF